MVDNLRRSLVAPSLFPLHYALFGRHPGAAVNSFPSWGSFALLADYLKVSQVRPVRRPPLPLSGTRSLQYPSPAL